MVFDFNYFLSLFPILISKLPKTLFLGISSFFIALFLGSLLSFLIKGRSKILSKFCALYISFFRSTPYITQLFILYFGLPQIFPVLSEFSADFMLVISISFNFSAYISEIIRGALNSVDKGQIEAAYSLSISRFDTIKYIVFPQAMIPAIPSLANSFIDMIKSTSMGFTIGVIETLSQARLEASSSFNFLECYVAVGVVYWVVVYIMDKIQKKLEIKFNRYL